MTDILQFIPAWHSLAQVQAILETRLPSEEVARGSDYQGRMNR